MREPASREATPSLSAVAASTATSTDGTLLTAYAAAAGPIKDEMVKRPAREKAVEARNAFFISDPPSQIMLLRVDYLTISSASEVQLFEARELL